MLTVGNRKRMVFTTGSYYFCPEDGREQVHSAGAWSPSSGPSFATGCETGGKFLCLSELSLQSEIKDEAKGGYGEGRRELRKQTGDQRCLGVNPGSATGESCILTNCQNPFRVSIFLPPE